MGEVFQEDDYSNINVPYEPDLFVKLKKKKEKDSISGARCIMGESISCMRLERKADDRSYRDVVGPGE